MRNRIQFVTIDCPLTLGVAELLVAISEPYVAVAIRQPPRFDLSSVCMTWQNPFTNSVPDPQLGVDKTSITGSLAQVTGSGTGSGTNSIDSVGSSNPTAS